MAEEVKTLVALGYEEIVLTGIHLSSYGMDFPENDSETLLGLMMRLDEIKGLKRMRLGSLEPRIITEDFVKALAQLRTICPHFHLSLQSGSDEVLRRMNRRYTKEEYKKGCQLLRKQFENPAITTDVIVGFPGETQKEFEETVQFVEDIQFYEMHVFKYSKREGTRAAKMEGQIEEAVKSSRSEVLLTIGAGMSEQYRRSFLGKAREVLLEEKMVIDGTEYLTGYTREYVKAAVLQNAEKKGSTVKGILKRMLTAEIVMLEGF